MSERDPFDHEALMQALHTLAREGRAGYYVGSAHRQHYAHAVRGAFVFTAEWGREVDVAVLTEPAAGVASPIDAPASHHCRTQIQPASGALVPIYRYRQWKVAPATVTLLLPQIQAEASAILLEAAELAAAQRAEKERAAAETRAQLEQDETRAVAAVVARPFKSLRVDDSLLADLGSETDLWTGQGAVIAWLERWQAGSDDLRAAGDPLYHAVGLVAARMKGSR